MLEKNPGVAAALSFCLTGLGQVYNGDFAKCMIMMVIQGTLILITVLTLGIAILITGPVLFIIWAWGIYDAYSEADKFNQLHS